MIGTIVTPMERGQITLPKAMREKLDIKPGTPLNVTLERKRITIEPLYFLLKEPRTKIIKAKIRKKKFLKMLREMKDVAWDEEDDKRLRDLRKRDEERAKSLRY